MSRRYADLAGDDNPVHLDEKFAATTRFKRCIVHGMLYGSLFGTIFGAQIPGSVYVSQRMSFKRPVYVGEDIVARVDVVRVMERSSGGPLVTCSTTLRRAGPGGAGELCLEGEAVVMLPSAADAGPLR